MSLHPSFPTSPYEILDPAIRWYPGDDMLGSMGYAMLLPPLVHKVRLGVAAWRASGYAGACATTKALLNYWFSEEHPIVQGDGTVRMFQWYFAQREAVESAIWLYEIERARDSYSLMRYDSSGRVSTGMFPEDWCRYVLKLATGAGKTKVMSLLMTWSYFHKLYEIDSALSTNFLLIAPNIIVLDRLRVDFDGARIFFEDPLLPPNGTDDKNWQDDFRLTVHIQDQIGHVGAQGNLFLSNIHRVYSGDDAPAFEDADTADYFMGKRPVGKTNDSQVDLGVIVRDVADLLILNDEAHHLHDPTSAWFRAIEDIAMRLRQSGVELSAQFDLTATPRDGKGAIFPQVVSDYPLVEAIRQRVVKVPVLPDEASRAKLAVKQTDEFAERYEDYLHLGYLEWCKVYRELEKAGKRSVLFVMTTETKDCDEVADYLRARYPEFAGKDAVLVIHTKNNGEISEAAKGKGKDELDILRKASREIDSWDSPYKVVVSVMMLREGWDVNNVTTIVGLRPFTATSKILPEQTLGRGLRRMFRGQDVTEKVSVIGTDAFLDFVAGIKSEGVELEYEPMGGSTSTPKSPLVVEVDRENKGKDLDKLDIELPVLAPRITRDYKNLELLDITALPHKRVTYLQFSDEQQREIIFRDMDTENQSHTTVMDRAFSPTYQAVVGFFTQSIMKDLRLVGGGDVLFGKIKSFIEAELFDPSPVSLDDLNTLRNLSEVAAHRTLVETIKSGINSLTISDKGSTEIRDRIKMSKIRPYITQEQAFLVPKKSIFNRLVGDSHFELEFASFLDGLDDIESFAKNNQNTNFRIEYQNADGGIANYIPDFIVKQSENEIWIVELKGREDLDDPLKWGRLQVWCADATAHDAGKSYRPMFIKQDDWDALPHRPRSFTELATVFG